MFSSPEKRHLWIPISTFTFEHVKLIIKPLFKTRFGNLKNNIFV